MAQLVLGVAGAALGGFLAPGALLFGITGAQAGWVIGSMVGSAFGPKQNTQGPRLDDLRVTGVEYGAAIPWFMGAPRISGQIWWASERRENATTEEVGGKGGGPTVTNYSYEVDVLYGLRDGAIDSVTRIWWNGKLVWSNLDDIDDQSLINSNTTDYWRRITVYNGADDQLPDPVYEAAVGADLAPGYRRRGCIFIEGMQLGQSGQLPNLTFEVMKGGGVGEGIVRRTAVADTGKQFADLASLALGRPAIVAVQPEVRVAVLTGPKVYRFTLGGEFWAEDMRRSDSDRYPGPAGLDTSGVVYSYPVGILGGRPIRLMQETNAIGSIPEILRAGWATAEAFGVGLTDELTSVLSAGRYLGAVALCSDGTHAMLMTAPSNPFGSVVIDQWHLISYNGASVSLIDSGAIDPPVDTHYFGFGNASTYQWGCCMLDKDLQHVWRAYGAGQGNVAVHAIEPDGVLRKQGELVDGEGLLQYGFTYPSIWVQSGFCVVVSRQSFQTFRYRGDAIESAALSDVVEALCLRAGMAADQFDASALASITKPVRAIVAAQVGPTRMLLEQLQAGYFFEVSLSDKLYFMPRASDAVAAIPYADLAAGLDEADSEPLALTVSADLETPGAIALKYRNVLDDQQVGTEFDPRPDASQASLNTVDLALAFTPTEAKAIVQAMVADAEASRTSSDSISLPPSYARLMPADVVEVVDADNTIYRMRLVRKTTEAGVLKFEALLDDAQAVEQSGVTDSAYTPNVVVTAPSMTLLQALDIPLLRDADDSAGYYVAARGATAIWPGAAVQSSNDGISYATVVSMADSAVFGSCFTALGDWTGGLVMDELNTVDVMVDHGELSSTTRDELLASATSNAMLIGSEVVRFVNAQLISADPNVFRLSRLIRGCRGTEWAIGTHSIGERAVLLRTTGMRDLPLPASFIGQMTYVRAVTLGAVANDNSALSFTLAGIRHKPFSPTNLRASDDGGGTYTVTWERRTRYEAYMANLPGGIVVPLGEQFEAYEVDVFNASDELVQTLTTSAPSATVGGPSLVFRYTEPLQYPHEFAGATYAVVAADGESGIRLARVDDAGAVVAQSATTLPGEASNVVYDGVGNAYVLTNEFTATVPALVRKNTLRRIDLATLTVSASLVLNEYSELNVSFEFASSMAFDGTHVWTIMPGDAVLQKHNATTLAIESAATFGLAIPPGLSNPQSKYLACDGAGQVFIGGFGVGAKVVSYDEAASPSIVWESDPGQVVGGISQLLFSGSLLFAAGRDGVAVLNPSTGAIVTTHMEKQFGPLSEYDGSVVYGKLVQVDGIGSATLSMGLVRVLDPDTGALTRSFDLGPSASAGMVGLPSGLVGYDGGSSRYEQLADFAGGRVDVYQMSAVVGRGYKASIDLD